MSAMEIIKAKNVPESVYSGMDQKALNALARALDPTFRVPVGAEVEIVPYTTKGKGQTGQYLSIKCGSGFKGVFEKLCDGDKLTPEGRTKALQLLTDVANQAADLADRI